MSSEINDTPLILSRERQQWSQLKALVKSDLYRYHGAADLRAFFQEFLHCPGFKYTLMMRLCFYLYQERWLRYTFYILARLLLGHYTYKFGISIPFNTSIDSGFYIGHFGGIVVNENAIIGKNCNISHGVTLGQANRGKRKGCPVLGDNVYIGPGAKLVGNVHIGNNVAIGANCVVTNDVPDNGVVVGIPGKVISYQGSQDYICNTDYWREQSAA